MRYPYKVVPSVYLPRDRRAGWLQAQMLSFCVQFAIRMFVRDVWPWMRWLWCSEQCLYGGNIVAWNIFNADITPSQTPHSTTWSHHLYLYLKCVHVNIHLIEWRFIKSQGWITFQRFSISWWLLQRMLGTVTQCLHPQRVPILTA